MSNSKIKLAIPTGRLQKPVIRLLNNAGLQIKNKPSDYRPVVNDDRFEVKMLKAANISKLVEYGAHDIGFSGRDWVTETGAEVEVLLDTGLMPVRIVSAAPIGSRPFNVTQDKPFVVVASEYENITTAYMSTRNVEYRYVRTYGATEVFPPEDADIIVDNVATGRTLVNNGLEVVDELMTSSTLFFVNRQTLQDPQRYEIVDRLRLLIQSVLDARQRVLLDMNVPENLLKQIVNILPAMKSPTIQRLYGTQAYAVRAAVGKSEVDELIPKLKQTGATDILQTAIQKVIA